MAQIESSFKNMVLVLVAIAIFAAGTLASVYVLTKEPIEASKIAKQQNAIKEVLPKTFDHLAKPDTIKDGNENMVVYKAYDATDKFIGAAVESSSNNGFSGRILVMVGFDTDGNIVNYSVLEQKETPGLGTKMVDWFKTNKGNQSVLGKNPGTANLTVSKDGGEIDAITASTISSRAFLFTIRNAYQAFISSKDQIASAAN
jgi:Na+-translocating ferredoxin:NAD+ oxidoreductase subunit G